MFSPITFAMASTMQSAKESTMQSNALKVKEFTEESMAIELPNTPVAMDAGEVKFIIKMVISEMTELAQTVTPGPGEALELVRNCVGVDFNPNYKIPDDPDELKAQQYDAFVDAMYYMYNAAAKKGVNLDRIFDVVHQSNLKKRWNDGLYHRNMMGKVIKPPEFEDPDVRAEIQRQANHGSF